MTTGNGERGTDGTEDVGVWSRKRGVGEAFLGLTGGEKCDDGGRKRLFRTARLPVWRCRTYHIAT